MDLKSELTEVTSVSMAKPKSEQAEQVFLIKKTNSWTECSTFSFCEILAFFTLSSKYLLIC